MASQSPAPGLAALPSPWVPPPTVSSFKDVTWIAPPAPFALSVPCTSMNTLAAAFTTASGGTVSVTPLDTYTRPPSTYGRVAPHPPPAGTLPPRTPAPLIPVPPPAVPHTSPPPSPPHL